MRCLKLPLFCIFFVILALCGEIAFSLPQEYDRFGHWKETDYELMAVPSYTNSQRVLPPPGFTNNNNRLKRDVSATNEEPLMIIPAYRNVFDDWDDGNSAEVRKQMDIPWPMQRNL